MAIADAADYYTPSSPSEVHWLPVPVPVPFPVPVPVDSARAHEAPPGKGGSQRGAAWEAQFDAMDLELRACVEEESEGTEVAVLGRRASQSRPGVPILQSDRSRLGIGIPAPRTDQGRGNPARPVEGTDELIAQRLQMEADAEYARHMEQRSVQSRGTLSSTGVHPSTSLQPTGGPARRPTWWRQQAAEMAATASVTEQPDWWRQQAHEIGLRPARASTRGDEALARQLQEQADAERVWDRSMRRALQASLEQPLRFAAPAASARVVNNATTIMSYAEDTGGSNQESKTCAICCEEFRLGVQVRLLPCLHMYHVACIDRWLSQSRTCPVCKYEITG